jgi:nucleotide-binding universal stress UspA family protein
MTIVAAVGETDRDEAVLEEAASLSRAFNEPVHVVYVLPSSEFVDIERERIKEEGRAIDRDTIDEYVQGIAEEISEDLDVTTKAMGLVGDIADNVVRYAEEQEARFIVIGLRKRSPTGKAMFGSVGQSILLTADQPVVSTLDQ